MKTELKKFATIITAMFLYAVAASQPAPVSSHIYFQQRMNYKIDVTLNDTDNTLDGFEIINYTNNSPDTLGFIWFHLWPNAYKNDRTAFSEQMLQLGKTDFYFSDNDKRGYINRLDFKVNGITAALADHPLYIDVAKLILPTPLLPGQTIQITTPFHEKIPYNFSRGGHVGQSYCITQWYPKPAVYDNTGWHPMPYLDQGEFYSEFGKYEVQITLPKSYVVAATGELQNEDELNFLNERMSQPGLNKKIKKPVISLPLNNDKIKDAKPFIHQQKITPKKNLNNKLQKTLPNKISIVNENAETKTIKYVQDSIHDFAWFADKTYIVNHDTLQLPSGKIIDVYSFYTPSQKDIWKNSIQFIKDAVLTRSRWLGEYPYSIVSAVQAQMGFTGGMEYPTITSISALTSEKSLDQVIEHEVGHNWNYGALATNERDHPWMDEGINSYYDERYAEWKYGVQNVGTTKVFFNKKYPEDEIDLAYRIDVAEKKDQPIEGAAQNFSAANYDLIVYEKTAKWMKLLEQYIGEPLFDSCMHEYYQRWKFKHPSLQDFKNVMEEVSKKNVDSIFQLLHQKGNMTLAPKKDIKVSALYNFNETDKHNYIFLSPSAGINYYDKLMIGGLIHNYTLPVSAFHFFAAPMYATASKAFAGIGRAGYNFMSYGWIRKAELSLSAEKFSMDEFTDSTGKKNFLGFTKIVPSLKIIFRDKSATSTITKSIQWKTYFINETQLLFIRDTTRQVNVISYPVLHRYLNQLKFKIENTRALYPYSGTLQVEQSNDFMRFALEGKYFFNYAKGGGMSVRLFAGKFIYLGDKTIEKEFETDRFHLNMTGANGNEDYTYSNYFIGRNEFQGASSQQIMIRDGAFKVRSDLLANKIGKTDNWLAAANFVTGFPKKINPLEVLPIKIPLKIFADAGTYAEAWNQNPPTGRFIYDGGLQLSLLKGLVNIYVPVVYSKVYADYFKSTITTNRFWKNISFSIDIENFRLTKFLNLPEL